MPETDNFKLIIEDDEGRRSVVPVDLGEVSIGRLEGNTIRLNERNVSRRHARLFRDNGSIVAEDLDSYNGVFINGDRIKGRHEVRDGDRLRVGDFQLELRGEGLQRRTEETTQRTLMPEMEVTQPEIRMGTGPQPSLGSGTQPAIPAAQMRSEPAEPESRPEPTAIIRMNHLEDVEASRRQDRAIAGQKAKLICVSTQFAGQEFEINKTEMVIGRTDENDIAIDHRSVSRHHAKVTVVGNSFKVVDLKSANGTLVNGEEYAQTDLKSGDLVELGHVKFRFVPPGENYTFTAEEAAAIQSKSGDDRSADVGIVPGAPPSTSVSNILRANPLIVMAIAGLMLMIAVMLVWMISNSGKDGTVVALGPQTTLADPTGRPTMAPSAATTQVPAPAGPISDVDSLLARANVAMAQRQWKQAAGIARGVMAFRPSNVQAQMIADKADTEAAAQGNYDNAVAAINGGRWSDAWNHLQLIGADSSYASQGGGLKDQVRAALITQLVASADTAVKSSNWDEALDAVQQIEALDADRPDVARIRSAVEDGRRRRAVVSRPRTPKPPREKKKPPSPPPSTDDPKEAYGIGIKALQGGQYMKALDQFNKCIRADKRFALCYRAMGITYARDGNGPKAYRYYKQYLKISPNAADAPQVRKLLESYEKAQ